MTEPEPLIEADDDDLPLADPADLEDPAFDRDGLSQEEPG